MLAEEDGTSAVNRKAGIYVLHLLEEVAALDEAIRLQRHGLMERPDWLASD